MARKYMSLSARLKTLGMTKQELELRSGMAASTINKYLAGKYPLNLDAPRTHRLLKLLQISQGELIGIGQ